MNAISSLTPRLSDWHPQQIDSKNFDFLDGLRGVAILLVVACHLIYVNPLSDIYTRFFGEILATGSYGVVLFFCLSGFLVSLPFWKRKHAGRTTVIPTGYVQRRFFKIYPPLFLSLIIITPIYFYKTGNLDCVKAAFQWLVGAPLLFPIKGTVNNVMWSLIPEVLFYISLPFVMLLFRKISMNKSIWLIPLLFALMGLISRYMFGAFGIYGSFSPVLYVPFLSQADVFAMGVLVAALYSRGFNSKSYAKLGNIGLLMMVIMLPLISFIRITTKDSPFQHEIFDFIMKIVFGFVLFLVADIQCFAARLLCNPLLRWCGVISYEWYLCHQVIFVWFRRSFGPANGSIMTYLLIVGGSFVTSLLVAALVYKHFSLPILIYGRSLHKPAAK